MRWWPRRTDLVPAPETFPRPAFPSLHLLARAEGFGLYVNWPDPAALPPEAAKANAYRLGLIAFRATAGDDPARPAVAEAIDEAAGRYGTPADREFAAFARAVLDRLLERQAEADKAKPVIDPRSVFMGQDERQ